MIRDIFGLRKYLAIRYDANVKTLMLHWNRTLLNIVLIECYQILGHYVRSSVIL